MAEAHDERRHNESRAHAGVEPLIPSNAQRQHEHAGGGNAEGQQRE